MSTIVLRIAGQAMFSRIIKFAGGGRMVQSESRYFKGGGQFGKEKGLDGQGSPTELLSSMLSIYMIPHQDKEEKL